MSQLIGTLLVWVLERLLPPKSTGRHARPKPPRTAAPAYAPTVGTLTDPAAVESSEDADDPGAIAPPPLLRPYVMTAGEIAQRREEAAQRRRREALERALSDGGPARDWTVSGRAAGVFA